MRYTGVGAMLVALVFAGLGLGENVNYSPDPVWKAPPEARQKPNPLANNPAAIKKGKELFETQCSMCHGIDGSGVANAANFHLAEVQKQSDGTLFWKLTSGNQVKGMPPFKRLPESDRWALVTYLRVFKEK